ncbi:PEP-CTERM putative exosortase interaction domain-containing protein [Cylindrospermum stagnale PCC 7417]|uniref:PEP-CTERM putative exosortase interaction domain-containing protein n=1 Tax=Cylindrospermum stagnale PCC 7417 TaxID=56107 RepID=K9X396_9NOST|nr:PEP-CTERM sorting domain-containing protein [Cylindrospermum stagnale]AFZ26554.1 PEP-CTERM putative exosortase interaction domain-containing protein [Cylindrospermum stagnale PCC 7417]
MFTNIKHSFFTIGTASLLSLGTLTLANPSYAVTLDLTTWNTIGDATLNSPTQATINSGTETVDTGGGTGSLEEFLSIPNNAIVNAIPNAVFGSAIQQTYAVNSGDVFSFNYNFSTTDSDVAFVTINNIITTLTASSPFSYSFTNAGNYNIGIGVVDVDDSIGQSTLVVTNADIQSVPEPTTMLGLFTGLGFGAAMRRRFRKQFSL